MKNLLLVILLIISTANAQVVQVKDIFAGATSGMIPTGVMPNKNSIVLNGKLIFPAQSSVLPRVQLWQSDGTETGTTLLRQIYGGGNSNPTEFTLLTTSTETLAVFSANDGLNSTFGNNFELWKTNGTQAGTTKIAELNTVTTANPGSFPQLFTQFGNYLYFKAIGGTTVGEELFATDGTAAGTPLVKNINPTNGGNGAPRSLTIVNDKLFFTADNGTNGRELYFTTGTLSTNVSSIDICSGLAASSPQNLTAFNNKLYFSAVNCSTGITGIWKSDGTVAGTTMVSNVDTGGNANPQDFIVSQGLLFFTAFTTGNGREMHYVDTNNQQSVYRSINPGAADAMPSGNQYIEYNNVLYFLANNGTSGNELWRIDRSISGIADTAMVKDINTSGDSNPSNFIVFGGKLLFQANDGIHGAELWQTDGTEAGTFMVADINPGSGSSSPTDFAIINTNEMLFTANDGTTGNELWKINAATLSNNAAAITENRIKIYPNPSENYFEISSELAIDKVEVFSMLGELIKTYPKQNQYETLELANGSYVVKIHSGHNIKNGKLVVN